MPRQTKDHDEAPQEAVEALALSDERHPCHYGCEDCQVGGCEHGTLLEAVEPTDPWEDIGYASTRRR